MNLMFTLGVELELDNLTTVESDMTRLRLALNEAGITGWVVKQDGSCGHDGAGPELNSPVLRTTEDLEGVEKVAKLVKGLGFKVTEKCGLHAHIGMESVSVGWRLKIMAAFAYYQTLFFKLAPTRDGNRFCLKLTELLRAQLSDDIRHNLDPFHRDGRGGTERYIWVNRESYHLHKTLEIRLMPGALNPIQICGWLKFLHRFCEAAVENPAYSPLVVPTWCDLYKDEFLQFMGAANSAIFPEAMEYYAIRLEDASGPDINEVRRERKRRLKEAWAGTARFMPVFARVPITAES